MRGSITLLLLTTLACGGDDTSVDADADTDSDLADASLDTSRLDAGDDASTDADAGGDTGSDADDDADDDAGDAAPDTSPPIEGTLDIDFPAIDALIDTETVFIRGRASASMGSVNVTANGEAVSWNDDRSSWFVELPIEPGELELDVELTLEDDQVIRALRTIRRSEYLAQPGAYEFDPESGDIYFIGLLGGDTAELLAVNVASGVVRFVADISALRTSGGAFPTDLVLDFENDRFLFTSSGSGDLARPGIWSLHRETGELLAWATGTFGCPGSAVLDPVRDRLVVHDPCFVSIFAVDSSAATVTTLSANAAASGPRVLDHQLDLSMDPDEERVIASADRIRGTPTVLGIDLDTGMRTVIADNSGSTGPFFSQPNAVVQPTREGPAYLSDRGVGLYEVNVSTGARRLMVSTSDVDLGGIIGLQHRGANPLILDSRSHLFEVDATTDSVELIASNRFNADREDDEVDNLVVAQGAAYFWDELDLVRMEDGLSSIVLSREDISPYADPGALVLSSDGSTLYVSLEGDTNAIGAFDIPTGEWSLVSGPTSDGIMLPFVEDLVYAEGQLFALTRDRILNVLLPSGARTLAISPVDPPTATSIQEGERLVVTEDTYFVLDGDVGLLAIPRGPGATVLVEVPGDGVRDIALGADGALLVLSGAGTVQRYDGDAWSTVIEEEAARASRVVDELDELRSNSSGLFAMDNDGSRIVQMDPRAGARVVLLQFAPGIYPRE